MFRFNTFAYTFLEARARRNDNINVYKRIYEIISVE